MPPTKVAAAYSRNSKPQLPVIRIPFVCSMTFTRGRLLQAAHASGSAKNSVRKRGSPEA